MTITKQQFDAAVEAERPKWGKSAELWQDIFAGVRDRLFPAESYTYDPAKPYRITVNGREYEITEYEDSFFAVWMSAERYVWVDIKDSKAHFISASTPRKRKDFLATRDIPSDLLPAVVALIRQHVGGGE